MEKHSRFLFFFFLVQKKSGKIYLFSGRRTGEIINAGG